MRIATAACALLFVVACNEHAVDACYPLCASSPANEELFAICVADGKYGCRPGDRRCCALSLECIGDIGDQVVVGTDCPRFTAGECLPECGEEDEAFFESCVRGEVSSCEPGATDLEECCAAEAGCRGSLGEVAVDTGDLRCCDDGDDCLRDELCDRAIHACVSADCSVDGFCPPGHECVGTECRCGDGPICHDGEVCVDGECADDPCLDCDAICLSDFSCVECVGDSDCELGFACALETNTCVACAALDETCDGVDDDCDDVVDDDFTGSVTCGVGACLASGTAECVDGSLVNERCTQGSPLDSADFTCDGVDDDCDGSVDEDCCGNDMVGGSEECDGTDLDGHTCEDLDFDGGTLRCLVGECAFDDSGCTCDVDVDMDRWCVPEDCQDDNRDVNPDAFEICNGDDDDCDGMIDEGASSSCDDGQFCNGVEVCALGRCQPTMVPDCRDSNDCTMDVCDEAARMCMNPPEPVFTPCFVGASPGTCDGFGVCTS